MQLRLIFLLLLLNSTVFSQTWMPRPNFAGGARDDGCSFTANNTVYAGTGRNAGFAYTSDFYAFDLTSEQWTQVSSLPDSAKRQYATAVTYANNGFLFGGINAQGEYLNDLWNYDPVSDFWDYLGQAPFTGRSGMQSFVIGDEMFVVGGRTANSNAVNEVWSYDFTTNSWSPKFDMPSEGIWRGFAAEYNGTGIIGMGTDSMNIKRGEVYFYDASIDFWLEMTALYTEPMNYPAASQIDDRIYVYGGEDTTSTYINDFRYLDLTNMAWFSLNSFPQVARRGSMAFTSSTDFFITTGLTTTERLEETWVARNVVGLDEAQKMEDITFYVSGDYLIVPDEVEDFTLLNSMGQLVPLRCTEPGRFTLPKGISAGMYIGYGEVGGRQVRGKILIDSN